MRKGNAALFLVIVSAVSLAITSYLAQQELTIRRTGAAVGAAPVGRINSIPQAARVGETIDIEAQVDDADKNLADPLSIFSNVIKIYYSKTVSPTNPNAWTEIPASQATYQCYTDNNGDHCKIFARWTPPEPGTFTFMVNGMDKAGNKCSGNPYFNYAGQTEWVRCGIANEDWREVVVTASPQVAGHIRDQDGKGIPNVSVGIYPQGVKEYIITTDANGYYSLQTNDLPGGKLYSVRAQPDAPAGHKAPPKTTNTTKSLNTVTNTNTPANSTAYENQKIGQGDCGKVEAAGIGCDFVYDKLPATASPTPTKSPTPTPKPVGTYSLSIAPAATVNLTVGQEQDVTVTLRENGQPVPDQNAFTYFWTVQSNNGTIDVDSISPRVKTIKGLKAGQVFIHISVTDDNNTVVTQSIMTVNVTQPSPTPSPTNTPTPTQTPTPTPTQTPTPTPSTVPEGSPTPSPVATTMPSPSPTPVSGCLKDKGDSNCDGRINLTDYAIWRQEYLGGCTSRNGTFKACGEDRDDDHRPIDADFNLDGLVKLIDFAIWRDNVQ